MASRKNGETRWRALLLTLVMVGFMTEGAATELSKTLLPVQQKQIPAPTLASHYHAGLDLRGYWVSEKYDGVRAIWDGQRLQSRQGLTIDVPSWFTAGWPAEAMDGELWAGRGQFAVVQSAIAAGRSNEAAWRNLCYMVFDMPMHTGAFAQRQESLLLQVAQINQVWVQAVPQWQVQTHAQLQAQLQSLTREGAEGLMLRHAAAPYRGGRSEDLIKLKTVDDAEAVVIGHLPGKGKYEGMTGALLMEMPNGQRFRLGSGLTDALRANPPAVGTLVSYRHNGWHDSGLPRFARFWRVREEAASKERVP